MTSEAIRSARIAAFAGILGALVGGAASFTGAYFNQQAQLEMQQTEDDRRIHDQRQAAYVEFLGEVQEYRTLLSGARNAVATRDQGEYAEYHAKLFEQGPVVYSARLRAGFLLDEDDLLLEITNAIFEPNEYINVNDCDLTEFDEAMEISREAVRNLETAAENDLGND